MGSSHSGDDASEGIVIMPRQPPPEVSVMVPGHSNAGGGCNCMMPPLTMRKMREYDAEYLRSLDRFSLEALASKKADASARFGAGFGRVQAAMKRIDKALDNLISKYSDLAKQRLDLEHVQQDSALVHLRHCKPLKSKLGLKVPCQEDFDSAMLAYRAQLRQPQCAVGATVPLAPAALGPLEGLASEAATWAAATMVAWTTAVGRRPRITRSVSSPRKRKSPEVLGAAADVSAAMAVAAAAVAAAEVAVRLGQAPPRPPPPPHRHSFEHGSNAYLWKARDSTATDGCHFL